MSAKVLRDEQFTKEYEVTLSPDAIQKGQEEWVLANAKDMKVDGFRPGKAPLKILMANYGATAREKAVNKILADQHQSLKDTHNLTSATLVSVNNAGNDTSGEKYTFLYDVPPQFDLVDPKKITVENLKIKIDDAAIDKTITTLRREEGTVTTRNTEDDYAIQDGDVVTYKIAIHEGENAIEEANKMASSVTVGLEEHAGYKLIADNIKGHKIGDNVTIKDVKLKDLEGAWSCINDKKVTITVTIETVSSVEMAALNEDLFKKFDVKTLDELKAKLGTILADQHIGQIELCHKRYIFDALDTAYDFDVSTKAVESEYDRVWGQFLEEKKEFEAKGQEHPDMKDKKLEDVKADYMKVAERRIRLTHILAKTAEANKIKLTEGDVSAYAYNHIRPVYPRAMELWGWRMREDENFRNEQIAIIHENKIAQYLHDKATHKDVSLTTKELTTRMKEIMPD